MEMISFINRPSCHQIWQRKDEYGSMFYHRDNDLPALIQSDMNLYWYDNGYLYQTYSSSKDQLTVF